MWRRWRGVIAVALVMVLPLALELSDAVRRVWFLDCVRWDLHEMAPYAVPRPPERQVLDQLRKQLPSNVPFSEQGLATLQTVTLENLHPESTNFACLKYCTGLRKLKMPALWGLTGNGFLSCPALPNLEELDLSLDSDTLHTGPDGDVFPPCGYPPLDITPLKGMTHLKRLSLFERAVTNTQSLAGLTELEELDLTRTGIEDLRPLEKLERLRVLKLGGKWEEGFEGFGGHQHLEELDVWGVRQTDLAWLKTDPNLVHLELVGCFITDPSPLLDLHELKTLLVDRYFDSPQGALVVRTLRARGVTVTRFTSG